MLAVVVPTRDPGTAWYVRALVTAAGKLGVETRVVDLADTSGARLATRLDELSANPGVHGIICQTPLPAGVTLDAVGGHIAVGKDVDGANPASLGRLAAGLPRSPRPPPKRC